MIVRIDVDEQYPVYEATRVSERGSAYGHQVWIPRTTFRRWERIAESYYRMQKEMRELYELDERTALRQKPLPLTFPNGQPVQNERGEPLDNLGQVITPVPNGVQIAKIGRSATYGKEPCDDCKQPHGSPHLTDCAFAARRDAWIPRSDIGPAMGGRL